MFSREPEVSSREDEMFSREDDIFMSEADLCISEVDIRRSEADRPRPSTPPCNFPGTCCVSGLEHRCNRSTGTLDTPLEPSQSISVGAAVSSSHISNSAVIVRTQERPWNGTPAPALPLSL
jgi:hypothetical protein